MQQTLLNDTHYDANVTRSTGRRKLLEATLCSLTPGFCDSQTQLQTMYMRAGVSDTRDAIVFGACAATTRTDPFYLRQWCLNRKGTLCPDLGELNCEIDDPYGTWLLSSGPDIDVPPGYTWASVLIDSSGQQYIPGVNGATMYSAAQTTTPTAYATYNSASPSSSVLQSVEPSTQVKPVGQELVSRAYSLYPYLHALLDQHASYLHAFSTNHHLSAPRHTVPVYWEHWKARARNLTRSATAASRSPGGRRLLADITPADIQVCNADPTNNAFGYVPYYNLNGPLVTFVYNCGQAPGAGVPVGDRPFRRPNPGQVAYPNACQGLFCWATYYLARSRAQGMAQYGAGAGGAAGPNGDNVLLQNGVLTGFTYMNDGVTGSKARSNGALQEISKLGAVGGRLAATPSQDEQPPATWSIGGCNARVQAVTADENRDHGSDNGNCKQLAAAALDSAINTANPAANSQLSVAGGGQIPLRVYNPIPNAPNQQQCCTSDLRFKVIDRLINFRDGGAVSRAEQLTAFRKNIYPNRNCPGARTTPPSPTQIVDVNRAYGGANDWGTDACDVPAGQ